MMEAFWRQARQAALRVWRQDAAALRCEPNAAALHWAGGLDASDPAWLALAQAVLQAPDDAVRPWRLGSADFEGQALLVEDGALLWWQAAAIDPSLAQAVQLAGLSIWRLDTQTERISYDPYGAGPTGMPSPQQGVALGVVRERIHPDDREAVRRASAAAIEGQARVDTLARYRQDDGRWCPVLTRRVAQRDAAGRLLGLLGVSLDLSVLVAERERMVSAAEAAGLGLWSLHGNDGRPEWNLPMYRIHHCDPTKPPPSQAFWWAHHVHPLDRERLKREYREAETQGEISHQSEFRVLTPEGRVRWVHSWTRHELRDGRHTAYGLHLDVTDRRGVEFELQQERERTLFALSAAGVGVWRRVDAQHSYWSEVMYRLRGLDPADPRPIDQLAELCLHPEDRAAWAEISGRYKRGDSEAVLEWEFRVVWPDGSVHWLVSRGRTVRDEQGRPSYRTGINVDVTGRHQAQALLLESQRLEQLKRTQSEFLARVSHELRTPLNAVLGFAQLLAYDASEPLSERQSERLARIDAAGRHLLALIDDVLDLARIDAEQQPLADEPVSLQALAQQALEWVAAPAQAAGIALRLAEPQLPGRVRADRRRLGQVAINLLTNAIKYNRAQGWVEVGTLARGRSEDGPAQWALVVRDSGRGLAPEVRQRIFEPFNRLGAELEGIAGTGIGLTIVRQLTERMGGQIELLSQPGVGSEFRIWLPADQEGTRPAPLDELPPLMATRPAQAGADARLKLLCIEDNPTNLQLVRELLALRPAVALSTADTGRAGIALALQLRPDVLLLDMQLPDLHGSEVLRALRRSPALSACRVIALSANAMPADIEAARAQGFDDYWTKPIELARFLRGIDALLA